MKERVFYVLNLDNRRIFTLAIFLVAMLFSFFFLGLSVGKRQGVMEAYKYDTIKPVSGNVATANNPSNSTPQEIIELKNQSAIPSNGSLNESIVTINEEQNTRLNTENQEPKLTTYEQKKTNSSDEQKKKSAKKNNHTKSKGTVKKSDNYYSLQVASFKNKEQAEKAVAQISDNDKIKSEPFVEKSGSYYLVKVGKYKKRSSAKKALTTVNKELKVNGMVVKSQSLP